MLLRKRLGNCVCSIDHRYTLTIRPVVFSDGMLALPHESGMGKWPWSDNAHMIRKVVIKKGVKAPETMEYMFAGMSNCDDFDIGELDTSLVRNMDHAFSYCYFLTDISSLKKWDVSNVNSMRWLFVNCTRLADISPIGDWDVSGVEDMSGMFSMCCLLENLASLRLWKTNSVKRAEGMFSMCTHIIDLSPLEKWNVSHVGDLSFMFNGCIGITDISPLAGWNVKNAEYASLIFSGCYGICDIAPLKNWGPKLVMNAGFEKRRNRLMKIRLKLSGVVMDISTHHMIAKLDGNDEFVGLVIDLDDGGSIICREISRDSAEKACYDIFLDESGELDLSSYEFAYYKKPDNQELCSVTAEGDSADDCVLLHTNGLEEGIRCAMCTNPMKTDRGCDGGCSCNEDLLEAVLKTVYSFTEPLSGSTREHK